MGSIPTTKAIQRVGGSIPTFTAIQKKTDNVRVTPTKSDNSLGRPAASKLISQTLQVGTLLLFH